MPIIATAGNNGDGAFTPAPEGVHRAVCVDVIDKGMVQSTFLNENGTPKMQHKVTVVWQIDELDPANGKRFLAFKRYTLSLNEKATLRKDLESWRGRAFTRDEEMGFDVEKVIGVSCIINIQHAKKADKTYANVVSVMPIMKGMPKLAPLDYVREVNRPKDAAPTASSDGPSHDEDDFVPTAAAIFEEDPVPFAWLLPFVLPLAGALAALQAV